LFMETVALRFVGRSKARVVQIFFAFHHNAIRERNQLRSKSRIKLAVAQYSVRLGHGDP
jgi:hypothetical protein